MPNVLSLCIFGQLSTVVHTYELNCRISLWNNFVTGSCLCVEPVIKLSGVEWYIVKEEGLFCLNFASKLVKWLILDYPTVNMLHLQNFRQLWYDVFVSDLIKVIQVKAVSCKYSLRNINHKLFWRKVWMNCFLVFGGWWTIVRHSCGPCRLAST